MSSSGHGGSAGTRAGGSLAHAKARCAAPRGTPPAVRRAARADQRDQNLVLTTGNVLSGDQTQPCRTRIAFRPWRPRVPFRTGRPDAAWRSGSPRITLGSGQAGDPGLAARSLGSDRTLRPGVALWSDWTGHTLRTLRSRRSCRPALTGWTRWTRSALWTGRSLAGCRRKGRRYQKWDQRPHVVRLL